MSLKRKFKVQPLTINLTYQLGAMLWTFFF